jgi:biopolymer transport protein ExbD
MAMNVGPASGDSDVMVDINTTPLIDVMLVLLTLLIITLPIQTHAVKLDMPVNPPPPPPNPPPVVELGVEFDGTVTWNNQAVNWDTLDGYLYLEGQKELGAQSEIHLHPDKLAKYDAVAKVLADAQRLGVVKIGFTGIQEYQ